MTDAELIARQARQIEELRDENQGLKDRIQKATLIISADEPMNFSKLGYT